MTNNDIDKKWLIVNINPYYEFNDEKNKILLDFNYVNYNSENMSTLYKVGESKIDYTNQRYNQDGNYRILTYKGDYKRTLNSKFNLSTGIKYSAVDTDSDLRRLNQDSNDEYYFNESQSDRFLVNENIFAFYTKIDFSHEDWNISGGLRWEESNTKGISESTGQTRSRKISKLFPSISVNRSINDKLGASLSYSHRINRPPYSSLNSFVYYYDPYTYEEGNPNLSSAFTNSFQFNITYDEQPFFSVGYDVTDDALFELVRQNDSTARTSRTEVNIKNYKNLNFQIFAPLNFTKGMNGYSGFIINMSSYDEPRLAPRLDLSKWSLTWFTNLEYQLPWGINSEISGYYSTGGLQGMIEYEWLAGLSFAVSKTFFSDQLKTNIGIGELLNRKFNGNIKYDNINANIVSDWSRYNVYLQMTYSFGSDYNRKKQRENSSEDEQNRIEKNN